MSAQWSAEENLLLKLLLPTNTHRQISKEFERRSAAKLFGFGRLRSEDAIRHKCDREGLTPESALTAPELEKNRWKQIREINAEYKLARETNTTGLIGADKVTRKILCLSDLHFPFVREDALEQALSQHGDADVLVLNGDILDGYIFSTFAKSKRIAAHHEYQAAFEFVRICSEKFPMVALISGNHDVRPSRALSRNNIEEDAARVLNPDLVGRIANGEEIDELGHVVALHDFKNVLYQANEPWYMRIGKTIFAHPHGWGGGAPGATVLKLHNIFRERMGVHEYDSLVIGHTHRIYKGIWQSYMLIEQGAMCARQPYEHKPDMRFGNAMNGYCVIYQDEDGNTDFNLSGVTYVGAEFPPKKEGLKPFLAK